LIIHDQEVSAVQVLGTLRVKCKNGRDIALRPSAKRLVALLAVLGPHARTDAALILWPDMPRERALSNLRTVLWRARQDASGLVIEQGDDCRLGRVSVDLEDVLSWARQAIRGAEVPPPEQVTRELLPSWSEEWLITPREECRLQQLNALEESAQRLLASGRLALAATSARAAVSMDPLRESATRVLLEVTLRQGNQVEALRHYRRYQSLLRREIGIEPSPAITILMASLGRTTALALSERRLSP
jgi:DNA-binding SARP family transcriptional activator